MYLYVFILICTCMYTVFIRIVAAATINFGCCSVRLLIEGGSYLRAALIWGWLLFEGGYYNFHHKCTGGWSGGGQRVALTGPLASAPFPLAQSIAVASPAWGGVGPWRQDQLLRVEEHGWLGGEGSVKPWEYMMPSSACKRRASSISLLYSISCLSAILVYRAWI